MKNEIKNYLVNEIKKHHELAEGINIDEIDYISEGYIDSIAIMRFLVRIEGKYDIEFTEDEITSERFRTVVGLAELIQEKRHTS